ncbi:hypothetical protein TNCV_4326791 [Trichonephila clavipes]|nr:hypothetical protein TNCV_4326791 [Trichonephila clavipes]
MENNICNSMMLTSRRRHFYLVGQSKHKAGACGVNNQGSAVLAGNEPPFVAFRPDGRGYELVPSVRVLVPQKFSVEEELMHVKHVDVQNSSRWCDVEVWKGSYQLRSLPPGVENSHSVPIRKPGKDLTVSDSYRSNSLLPILNKLVEKVILNRLTNHILQNNILIPRLRVVDYGKSRFAESKSTGAVFLLIQKAFDRV